MLRIIRKRQGATSTVKTFIRLMPVLVACVATQAFASNDPPTTAPVESAKPSSSAPASAATTTSTAETPAATAPATAPATGQRLVLEDKTLTNTEVQRLLSQGYKPQKSRNDTVIYCRNEAQMGTHFEKKVCMSADQIKQATLDSSDLTRKFQQNQGSSSK
jgi:cytoskeletal protein RodZ